METRSLSRLGLHRDKRRTRRASASSGLNQGRRAGLLAPPHRRAARKTHRKLRRPASPGHCGPSHGDERARERRSARCQGTQKGSRYHLSNSEDVKEGWKSPLEERGGQQDHGRAKESDVTAVETSVCRTIRSTRSMAMTFDTVVPAIAGRESGPGILCLPTWIFPNRRGPVIERYLPATTRFWLSCPVRRLMPKRY